MLFITKLSQISVLLQMVLHVRKVCVFYEAFLCFECEHSTTVHLMATGGGGGGTNKNPGNWSNIPLSMLGIPMIIPSGYLT